MLVAAETPKIIISHTLKGDISELLGRHSQFFFFALSDSMYN